MPMTGASALNIYEAYGIDKQELEQGTKPGQIPTREYAPKAVVDDDAAQATWYGWLSGTPQVGSMSYGDPNGSMSSFFVDQVRKMPISSSSTVVRAPARQRSLYERYNHYRQRFELYTGWRVMRDDSNTLIDYRGGALRVKPQPTAGGGNLPGGVRMNAPLSHDMMSAAWRIPRFSTEPYTIIPQGTNL
jgi:hypothetical protein